MAIGHDMSDVERYVRANFPQEPRFNNRIQVLDNRIRAILDTLPRSEDNYVLRSTVQAEYKKRWGQSLAGDIAAALGMGLMVGITTAYFRVNKRAFDCQTIMGKDVVRAQYRGGNSQTGFPSCVPKYKQRRKEIPSTVLQAIRDPHSRLYDFLRKNGYLENKNPLQKFKADYYNPSSPLYRVLRELGYEL